MGVVYARSSSACFQLPSSRPYARNADLLTLMRFKALLLTIHLLVAMSTIVSAQYRFDLWNTDNGLPQNGVRQITQTPDGYLWFTTFDGLVRFDGVRFSTFNKSDTQGIVNSRFTGIYADLDGTVYATTMEDGVLTIYRDGAFWSITSDQVPGHYIARIETSSDGTLRFLSEDEDRRSKSWYSFSDGRFEFIEKQADPGRDATVVGKCGTTWTVGREKVTGVRGEYSFEVPLDLSAVPFKPNVFESSDCSLWVGENRVHHVIDGKVRTFSEESGLPRNSIYHSFWEEEGSVWVSSGGASSTGVGLIQFTGETVNIWGKDHGLPSTSIENVFHDREGTVWLATTRGLVRRRKQSIRSFSVESGLNYSEVYPMLRDRSDNIWIGTSRGLSVYRDGKFEEVNFGDPPAGTPVEETWRPNRMSVQSLYEDQNGRLWVGLNGGIFLVDGGRGSMLLKGGHVYAIRGDSRGNVWAATNKGLLTFTDYKLAAQYSTREGLPNEFMTFILEDSKGVMWFGGYGGLSRFENGQFTNYTARDGLTGNYVRTIYEDAHGTLWIGTYDEGLSRFRDGRFTNYREEQGLYSSGVFAIEEDSAGSFWISSNRGIYRIKRSELEDFAAGTVDRINSVGYGKEDGMLSNECNGGRQPASLRDSSGRLWFPTQEGVSIVDPAVETATISTPTPVIEEILAERGQVPFNGGAAVEPGKKDLEIKYTGVSLIKSDQIRFQYKLEGHDIEWIDAGRRRTAYYSYLPPGDYVFRVRAANSDGNWSSSDAAVSIELKPFFYQTRAFLGLCGAAAILMLLGLWKLVVYRLGVKERKLKQLVAERTAELARANEELEALANSDGLTRIGNRRRFESFLADEWHRAVRFKTEISLVLFDIDHFKLYNDLYGHQAGDECLQKVAEAFAAVIKRPTDLVARFGGEEFAMILGGTPANGALQLAEAAVENVRDLAIEHSDSPTSRCLTVSVGIATVMPTFELTENDLIKLADSALYRAKRSGRDRIFAFDQVTSGSISSVMLERDVLLAR